MQVQDAFGTPGSSPTLGPNELVAFDAIGLSAILPAPEPSEWAMAVVIGLAFGGYRLRRRASRTTTATTTT